MTSWLDPIRNSLDAARAPVTFFFRDDDAGWEDNRLFRLLDIFAACNLPIDIAVIPQAIAPTVARKICGRIETGSERIGIHQHGFAHKNHEQEGRKCEFGSARSEALQYVDIASGKYILAELFGLLVQPIFTPPWNRCLTRTGECLLRLDFKALSRGYSAGRLNISGLHELPVRVDWFAKHKGERLRLNKIGELIASAINEAEPVGLMFHHALMDEGERKSVSELLILLAAHDRAQCRLMHDIVLEQSEKPVEANSF
jgi:hypothetical protein